MSSKLDSSFIKKFSFLNDLESSEFGIVKDIHAKDEEFNRLKSMGVCRGRAIEVIKKGDPLIVRVYGTRIGISSRLADGIEIQKCSKNV